MNIIAIFLALNIVALLLLELSPKYVEAKSPNKKTREIDEIKFAESERSKQIQANETTQYAVMRIIVSLLIAVLGIIGAMNVPMPAYATFAFIFLFIANLAIALGRLEGFDVIKYTTLGLVAKIFAQLCFIIAISLIIDNTEVCVATVLLGFIVGAVYLKVILKKSTLVHSYYVLVNALKFSNLGLCIIALIYNQYAFPILAVVGYVLIIASSTMYVVNKKGLIYLSSSLHYIGYIILALSLSYV